MTAPRFLVEHRDGTTMTVLADHLVPLSSLAARLLAEGKGGELIVRNAETGHVHIRYPLDRALDPPSNPPGPAARRDDGVSDAG
jgi:hypothetical protein